MKTRDEQIEYLESIGALDPNCPGCRVRYEAKDPSMVLAPSHKPSERCESGSYPHCTCDSCF